MHPCRYFKLTLSRIVPSPETLPLSVSYRRPRDDHWMQAVAQEMNLSETALLVGEDDGFRLRWFTPKIEVDLCGHATLASAHVLFRERQAPPDRPIHFHTKSGPLKAVSKGPLIELDFPLEPAKEQVSPLGLLRRPSAYPPSMWVATASTSWWRWNPRRSFVEWPPILPVWPKSKSGASS